MDAALMIHAHGVSVCVEEASGEGVVLEQFRPFVPRSFVVDRPPVDVSRIDYRIEHAQPRGADAGWIYRVERDGSTRFESGDPSVVAEWLRAEIEPVLAIAADDVLFVHAAAVAWRGHGILIPGRSMTGKSTLVEALVRQGATYYSDEYAIIDQDGELHPYARPIGLRGRNGGKQWRSVCHDRSVRAAPRPVPVSLLVSTQYQAGSDWQPSAVTGSRAVLPVIDNAVIARVNPVRTMQVASQLARRVVTLKGSRPDAETAAPAILSAMDDLLGDKACVRAPRYVRIPDFLSETALSTLLDFVDSNRESFVQSQVDTGKQSRLDAGYRLSQTHHHIDPIWDLLAERLVPLIPALRKELGVAWFPVDTFERQLTVHGNGEFFKVHTDNGSPLTARRQLTAVFHFFREPRRFSGGELELYHPAMDRGAIVPGGIAERLEPLNNSLTVFRSDTFHAVAPVRCGTDRLVDRRCAITIWCKRTESRELPRTGQIAHAV